MHFIKIIDILNSESLTRRMLPNRVFTLLLTAVSSATYAASIAEPFDGRWQLSDQHSVVTDLKPAFGDSDETEHRIGGNSFSLQYVFRSNEWYADARYRKTDDLLKTGLKSSIQSGKYGSELEVGRSWGSNGWLTQRSLSTSYQLSRNNDGQLLADRIVTQLGLAGPKQTSLKLQYHDGREYQEGRLIDFDRVVVKGSIQPRDNLELGVETLLGDRIVLASVGLAEQRRVQQFLNWNVSDSLALELDNTFVDMASLAGQAILDANVVNAHLTWQFDETGSVRLSMRQRDVERNPAARLENVADFSKDLGSELRYSWKPNPETEFNLGYSDTYENGSNLLKSVSASHNWFMQVAYSLSF